MSFQDGQFQESPARRWISAALIVLIIGLLGLMFWGGLQKLERMVRFEEEARALQPGSPGPDSFQNLNPSKQPPASQNVLGEGRDGEAEAESSEAEEDSTEYRPNQRIVRFEKSADYRGFLRGAGRAGFSIIGKIPGLNTVLLETDDDDALREYLEKQQLEADPARNPILRLPREPDAREMAGTSALQPFGAAFFEELGISDNADWGRGVRVAVLDGGVVIHRAFGGRDPAFYDLLPDSLPGEEGLNHGTAMASIIGGDLSRGIGIAPAVDLHVYRVLDAGGQGDAFTLAEGIMQAADRGANIINMSLGAPPGSAESAVLNSALAYAMEKGALIVAAAGNDGAGELGYPANQPGVISVAAGDASWQSLPSSNVGYPSFTAPGYGVPAAHAGSMDSVSFSTGTSPAAAVLSGILAAEMSRTPSATATELLTTLRRHSNDFGEPGNDAIYGYGLPDPLRLAQRGSQTLDVASAGAYVSSQDETSVTVRVTAQNRGTVPLVQGQLFIDAGGIKSQPSLSGLAPNETRAFPITIPKNRIEPGNGIPINVTTGTGFATDVRPDNNELNKVLHLLIDDGAE